MKISGRLIDIHQRRILDADIYVSKGKIGKIERRGNKNDNYIMPGLIDAHIHIESSMLTPAAFAMAAVPHGTIGVVSDPHEIANVLGIRGIDYMIEDSMRVPFKFWFGAPSCVPATGFETSGGKIEAADIEKLIKRKDIKYLSEMMNFPAVTGGETDSMVKIEAAKKEGKRIDGHAPGLSGDELRRYVNAGISTDHECSTMREAQEKISLGMKILLREGSAARNLDALKDLFIKYPDELMMCSDDLHPEMLREAHMNRLVAKLISEGYDMFDVIRSATMNPVKHYNLDAGILREGDDADFILVDSPDKMNILETWINGEKVYDRGRTLFSHSGAKAINNFNCKKISESDIIVKNEHCKFRVIEAFDGELITGELIHEPEEGYLIEPETGQDILKIVVKDRYNDAPPAVGFIRGFKLQNGAFGSSVAHDSHNIIAVGTNNRDIVTAINEIVSLTGGMAVANGTEKHSLKLDVAGIMSTKPCSEVASEYEMLTQKVKNLGCKMSAPFMTLSFMALLVIPELKLSDRGLFDGKRFLPVPLFVK